MDLKEKERFSWEVRGVHNLRSGAKRFFDENDNKPCVYKKINKGTEFTCLRNGVLRQFKKLIKDMRRMPYVSAVASLMYIMICTRLDICYAMGIVRYTDSDFQTNKDSRKFTLGSVFTLNRGAVVWHSIKQGYIRDSTMEAEYVVTCEAAKEAVWLKKFLYYLEVVLT
ncbi:gag/pol protein [Cucumis melo var. makuwa]|uniref:Gag/pol protein n=1 Tax=Cucumis melo var. makuwa TaxID=1194695 RepID=A0A5D3DD36_CUCMM|nr:gag/pol protein [Cucumis melo var. makuwa]TYK21428.1 gag/pol protein [Cucumis melo var. makuwa]